MTTSPQVWIPAGPTLSKSQAQALAVQTRAKPAYSLYLDLLSNQIQKMVDEDKQEAQLALEMSQEQAPEMSLIAKSQFQGNWGAYIVNSDSMQILLNQIDWTLPGMLSSQPLPSLRELLEQLP